MDKQFDELSKSLAEGVSRREAVRKFGAVLAGVLLAVVGLSTQEASAQKGPCVCNKVGCGCTTDLCLSQCRSQFSPCGGNSRCVRGY